MSKLIRLIGLVLVLGSGYFFLSDDHAAKIEIVEDVLFFHGELSDESVKRAISLAKGYSISRVNINSEGGEVISAIMLANWIRDNKLDVEITDMCFSSCANYVFPAGMVKYVSRKDLIGWHGGAYQENEKMDDPELEKMLQEYIKEAREKETKLYQRLGINPDITTLGQMDEYYCQHAQEHGWYYSVADLNKLGIDNIVLIDGEWSPSRYHSKDVCQVKLSNLP